MTESLRMLAVLAHPDDETFAVGGALARYAAEGVSVHLVTATRGDRGRYFTEDEPRPGDEEVGRVREQELVRAAEALGVEDVHFLGYRDGELSDADPDEAVGRIVGHLRRVRPHVVLTFDPFGVYGHPDHVAVCQLTTAAVVACAAPADDGHAGTPHQVSKLYFAVMDRQRWDRFRQAFRGLAERIEGKEREMVLWPEWSVSTRVDARGHWKKVRNALACHQTQIGIYEGIEDLSDEEHAELWGPQPFYRAFSLVDGGAEQEDDLLAGLR